MAVEFLHQLNVPFFKVGSGDTNNFPYLEKTAKKGESEVPKLLIEGDNVDKWEDKKNVCGFTHMCVYRRLTSDISNTFSCQGRGQQFCSRVMGHFGEHSWESSPSLNLVWAVWFQYMLGALTLFLSCVRQGVPWWCPVGCSPWRPCVGSTRRWSSTMRTLQFCSVPARTLWNLKMLISEWLRWIYFDSKSIMCFT